MTPGMEHQRIRRNLGLRAGPVRWASEWLKHWRNRQRVNSRARCAAGVATDGGDDADH